MNNIRAWLRRLRLFVFRDRATRELEDEMRLHRELRAAAMETGGTSGDAATIAARRTFGNPAQLTEQSRDAWGLAWLDDLRQDVRYAARRLRQRPAFTTSVAVILALGIGATTAMFSAVDAAILRPLPFPHAEQLVTLSYVRVTNRAGPKPANHVLDIDDVTALRQTFSHVAAYAVGGLNMSEADQAQRLEAAVVTPDFFATIGVAPWHGRSFTALEGRPGGPDVVVLSHGIWQRRFGGRSMIGQTVSLNDRAYVVVGIMPAGFHFPAQTDVWVPMTLPITSSSFEAMTGSALSTVMIARTANGVNVAQADRQLRARWNQALATSGMTPGARSNLAQDVDDVRQTGAAIPLHHVLLGGRGRALEVLFAASALLLLISAVNVTNLLLSQGASRAREMSVRQVLGARRGRILRQLLVESVLLTCGGTALGVALAPVALRLIVTLLPPGLAALAPIHVDLLMLCFAALLALLVGIGAGLWPAVHASRDAPGSIIKSGTGHGATARRGTALRGGLVSVEIALTTMLLIGAVLLLRSLDRLSDVDIGIRAEHVATARIAYPRWMADRSGRLQQMHAIAERLRRMAGITSVGFSNDLPTVDWGIAMSVEPDPTKARQDTAISSAHWMMTTGGYFSAMGIAMLQGRDFSSHDDSLAPPVAILSSSLAKQYFPGASAIGHTISLGGDDPPATVVGVVADVKDETPDRDPFPQVYFPLDATPPANVVLVVRGTLAPATLLHQLVAAVHHADPSQAVYDVRLMRDVVAGSVASEHTSSMLMLLFAMVALATASFGIYAVLSHGVTQRRSEFAIRSALGANSASLLRLVSREMAWVAGPGLAVGLASAWVLSHVASSLLYGVTIHDTVTFVAVPLILLLPAALATWIPARRAARVKPAEVMRAE
jgi:predicted permease